jgi:hypothetical protein
MLLVLVLPWQALTAVAMPAVHSHGAAAIGLLSKIDANAASVLHADTRHAGHEHHENGGVAAVQDRDSGSTSVAYGTCTDVCCSPALVAHGALPLATADHHGLMIPFATQRLPSPAPDSLERPPRSFLV